MKWEKCKIDIHTNIFTELNEKSRVEEQLLFHFLDSNSVE